MKVLDLIVKQKFFDEILSGEKNQEFREIRPTTAKKYIRYVCGGKEYGDPGDLPEDGEVGVVPVKYDAIRFTVRLQQGPRQRACRGQGRDDRIFRRRERRRHRL